MRGRLTFDGEGREIQSSPPPSAPHHCAARPPPPTHTHPSSCLPACAPACLCRREEAVALRDAPVRIPVLAWLYSRVAVGRTHRLTVAIERSERKLGACERAELAPTGAALVVYAHAQHAAACVAANARSPLASAADWATCGCSNGAPRLAGALVRVRR